MQQAPQYPQRQAIMQGHQMPPGQQAYAMAYQNAGYGNPAGMVVSTIQFCGATCLQLHPEVAAKHAPSASSTLGRCLPWNWEAIQDVKMEVRLACRHT